MTPHLEATRILRQPITGIVVAGVGLAASAIALTVGPGIHGTNMLMLGAALMAAVLLAYQFPIYIRHNTKICIISVPLFLLAALLPPGPAGVAVFLSVLVSELVVMPKRGTNLLDALTMTGRWSTIVVLASAIAHVSVPVQGALAGNLTLAFAAATLWVGDLLTLPLGLVPMSGERPRRILVTALREGGMAEAAQYVLGIIGALLAQQQVWLLLMLLVPTALVHVAFRKVMDTDTLALLESMADTVDLRGSYTAGHSKRVRDLAAGILAELGMQGQEADQILIAARFHDIGKLGLPDELWINPGTLTPEQQRQVEEYPERGARLMEAYPDFSRGLEMVLHHHEHWDGSGYPGHLEGTDIPFGARIIAVADAFDAMTSERPYRRARSLDQTAQILINGAGRQWDADIVQALLRNVGHRLDRPLPEAAALSESAAIPATQRMPA